MPLTSSSAEATREPSATESLAARYRHLFVLPSAQVVGGGAVAVSLVLSLVAAPARWPLAFVLSSMVAVLSASAVSAALKIRDRSTIATFRRAAAVILASQLLWLFIVMLGSASSHFAGTGRPLTNAVLYGAFMCAGFEYIVINGVFTKGASTAAALGAVHPAATLLVVGLPPAGASASPAAFVGGLAALLVVAAFIPLLRRRRTSRGDDAVELFQAFMKTWTNRDAADLEEAIERHAKPATVTTRVMRFKQVGGSIFIVLPGVHPGPFFPVGSYNLPGLISQEFAKLGPVLTLHRPGGHENNLASNAQAHAFAAAIAGFAGGVATGSPAMVAGPMFARVGKAAASATAFGGDLVVTISFAPLGSDDLDPGVEQALSLTASAAGLDASVVDAHNSIGIKQEHPDTADPGWANLFRAVKGAGPKPLRVAHANSHEVGFHGGGDVTEAGIGLLMLDSDGTKSVIVLADANNAVPQLHGQAAKALAASGYQLVELCTSDSHDLAARGLTVNRGYKALGEDTAVESIAGLVVGLAKLAESRLAECSYGSGKLESEVSVFGSESLEEFAAMTQSSSRFAKRYSRIVALSTAVLFGLAILF